MSEDSEEDYGNQLELPKYTLLYSDIEVSSRLPVVEDEDRNQKDEEQKEEPEDGDNPKVKDIDRIITAIAELAKGKKLTDKELCLQLKEKLDKTPELNEPSISGADIEENGVWQVIIGKQFAASVTFDAKYIYYFLIEEKIGSKETEEDDKPDEKVEKLDDPRKYFLVFRS